MKDIPKKKTIRAIKSKKFVGEFEDINALMKALYEEDFPKNKKNKK